MNHPKLFRSRTPHKVVDRTLLVEYDPESKLPAALATVALVAIIHLGLCEDQNLGAKQVPLYLCAVRSGECVFACGGGIKGEKVVNLDGGGGAFPV